MPPAEVDVWDEELTLPTAPSGVHVSRERASVRITAPLPGSRVLAWALLLVAALAVAAFLAALRAQPGTTAMAAAWWAVVICSALAAIVTTPLAALAWRARRLVVITPGVLLVREGAGPFHADASCLRGSVRAVETVADGHGHVAVRVESELSPTALRMLGMELEDPDSDMLMALPVCRGEQPEVARFYGEVIAHWAHAPLVAGTAESSDRQIV